MKLYVNYQKYLSIIHCYLEKFSVLNVHKYVQCLKNLLQRKLCKYCIIREHWEIQKIMRKATNSHRDKGFSYSICIYMFVTPLNKTNILIIYFLIYFLIISIYVSKKNKSLTSENGNNDQLICLLGVREKILLLTTTKIKRANNDYHHVTM